jgi:predicted ATPase
LVESVAQLAWRLLEACPALRVLATSRQRLGLTGEIVWRVPSLPVPDPGQMPSAAEGAREYALRYPAVQLFVERAGATRPGFQLIGRAEALAVAQICRRLDGIPLAIELAAARVMALTVGQIAARLADRFRLLTGGSRAALPRQRTLQALIDWSYDLLPEAERAVLRRLSVFVGGWSLDAAEALSQSGDGVQDGDALDLLSGLVEKSLVVYEPRMGREGAGGTLRGAVPGRYRMLETVREYAREKLRSRGEEALVSRRHAAFFLRLAEEACEAPRGRHEEEALARLEREWDNLRAALTWSQSAAGDLALGLRLGTALRSFWVLKGFVAEGRACLAALLARVGENRGQAGAHEPGLPRADARAQACAGWLELHLGNYEAARRLSEESLALGRALEDRPALVTSLKTLANVAARSYDEPTGRRLFEELLALYQEAGDPRAATGVLLELGEIALRQGDLAAAGRFLEQAFADAGASGDRIMLAKAHSCLGTLALAREESERARNHHEAALALHRELGDRVGIFATLNLLASVHLEENDPAAARPLCEESLGIARELGNLRDLLWSLSLLGQSALVGGDLETARALFEECEAISRKLGDRHCLSRSLFQRARTSHAAGDLPAARDRFIQVLQLRRELSWTEGMLECLEGLARVAADGGEWERSARLFAAGDTHRAAISATPVYERGKHGRYLRDLATALGEAAFAAAWAEGRALALEDAVTYALQHSSIGGGSLPCPGG